ncbi:MAG: MerR family transcriptional regulator [Coriobacteriaceae bacterium]|jgi:DNA-binding transcriptional MerR regulator|nr:MerR family transcriptional regulator [Coriobacteriaceae bacterium]
MTEPEYFSVGELAQRVGVTVRTIQYYDQEGLLSPSAKGPQNQRLYTEGDLNGLYRILTLKYLGRSLAEIKADAGLFEERKALHGLAGAQMDEIEKSFQQLFRRLTTLRNLIEATGAQDEMPLDWHALAQVIEDCQEESQFFWRLICIREDELHDSDGSGHLARDEMVSKWHELIADAIRLEAGHEPLDSPNNRDLAKRYLALDESQQALSIDQNFILMENIAPAVHGVGSFDALRKTVCEHLEAVVAAYLASP